MTHQLSRRERKAMRRAGNEPSKSLITVDSKGIKSGVVYVLANVVAVFIFPFWMIYRSFVEWMEGRKK